jgi:hypothetical protein
MKILQLAAFVAFGVMLGITLVDMSVGEVSTIGRFFWDLF